MNPDEQCNRWVKHDRLTALPASIEELRRLVRGRFARLRHRPELLRAFFAHAGLPVSWVAFCYPGPDDVAVGALGLPWTVAYWHEHVLFFRASELGAA